MIGTEKKCKTIKRKKSLIYLSSWKSGWREEKIQVITLELEQYKLTYLSARQSEQFN